MTVLDLDRKLRELSERVGDECKYIRLLVNLNKKDLSALNTNDKSSLVAAINEIVNVQGLRTDLSISANDDDSITIASSTGDNVDLTAATQVLAGLFSASDKIKLDNIEIGATNNSPDSFLLNRTNHTGTQLSNTISDFDSSVDARVILVIDDSTPSNSTTYSSNKIHSFFDNSEPILGYNKTNWDTAFGWGDHSTEGYLTSYIETDPIFLASDAAGITVTDIANWDTAFGWGNHAIQGYLTSFTESDPVFTASDAASITASNISNWDTAFGWGNHASAGYLESVVEGTNITIDDTDPLNPIINLESGSLYTDEDAQDAVAAAIAAGSTTRISIGYDDVNNLFNFTVDDDLSSYDNSITQFLSSGDNVSSLVNDSGYLTSYTETDPVFTASQAFNITATDITNLSNLSGVNTGDQDLSPYQLLSEKGAANGYVPLNASSLIDSVYLPSYVDDVLEYADFASFPVTGEIGKIYIDLDQNELYRWSGTVYVQVGGTGAVNWGAITGTLSDQTDLQTELDGKSDVGHTHTTSDITNLGSYTGFDSRYYTETETDNLLDDKVNVAGDTMTGRLTLDNNLSDTLRIVGTGTGVSNSSYISFFESDGSTRQGYLGFPSNTNSDYLMRNDVSGQNLALLGAGGSNGVVFFDGTSVRTVWHSGNLTPSDYVEVSGDTMTGDLTLNAGTSQTNFYNYRTVGGTDYYARVTVDGSGRASFLANDETSTPSFRIDPTTGAEEFEWLTAAGGSVMTLSAAGDLIVDNSLEVQGEITTETLVFDLTGDSDANDFLTFMPTAQSIAYTGNSSGSNWATNFGNSLMVRGATENRSFSLYKANGNNANFYLGNYNDSGNTWEWNEIWHEGNLTPSDYVAVSGDTMTGDLTVDADLFIKASRTKIRDNGSGATVISQNGGGTETIIIRPEGDFDTDNEFRIGTGGEFSFDGNDVWHEGNFTPSDYAELSTTTGNLFNYLHLQRNNSSNPVLYVNQTGNGDIARFYKGGSDSATSGTNQVTITNVATIKTPNDIVSGEGSGGVALTVNDGQGNANVTFNHADGQAEQAGNVGRIVVNTDSTTDAKMQFEIDNNNSAGAIDSTERFAIFEDYSRFLHDLRIDTDIRLRDSPDRPGLMEVTHLGSRSWYGMQIKDESGQLWSVMGNDSHMGIYDDTNSKWHMQCYKNSIVRLYYNGVNRLETTSAGITVNGDATADDFNLSSDIRLKDNIRDFEARGRVDWKLYEKNGRTEFGAIAQDVEKYAPELVKERDDEMKTLSYRQLQILENKQLWKELDEEKERNNKLEKRLERLEKLLK